jgi:hypothetical protein
MSLDAASNTLQNYVQTCRKKEPRRPGFYGVKAETTAYVSGYIDSSIES